MHLLLAALVTIRIYNYAAVPPAQLADARASADRIFQEAGIALSWVDCRVPGAAGGAACTEPLDDSGEFVLRLIQSPGAREPRHAALGSSLIDRNTGGGVLMTVDRRLVDAVSGEAGVDRSLVLGRAIAHEIGHLLIGTSRHAPAGLMRALWSQAELRGNRPSDWSFSPDEAAVMKRTLAKTLSARVPALEFPGSLVP